MSTLTVVQEQKCFGGRQIRYQHASTVLNCEMKFSVFLPPQAATQNVPALYWLSGLTCSDENFSTKAGAQPILVLTGKGVETQAENKLPEGTLVCAVLAAGAGHTLQA